MKNKVLRETKICILIRLLFLTVPNFFAAYLISLFSMFLISIIFGFDFSYGITVQPLVYSLTIILTIILDIFTYQFLRAQSLGKALSQGYRDSIRAALQAEYPEGIVYILENILKQFEKFSLNLLPPEKTPYTVTHNINYNNNNYPNISQGTSRGISDVKGFPNQTNLREAIDLAQTLREEWSNHNRVERGRSMGEIRARIQTEDMWLDWRKLIYLLKNKSHLSVYSFSYTEEDHRNNQPIPSPTPQTPNPKPNPANPSQVLSFNEWINQSPVVKYFTEQEQREAYEKYLKSMGIFFEKWLDQNPALQYFPEDQQREAYLEYLNRVYFLAS